MCSELSSHELGTGWAPRKHIRESRSGAQSSGRQAKHATATCIRDFIRKDLRLWALAANAQSDDSLLAAIPFGACLFAFLYVCVRILCALGYACASSVGAAKCIRMPRNASGKFLTYKHSTCVHYHAFLVQSAGWCLALPRPRHESKQTCKRRWRSINKR